MDVYLFLKPKINIKYTSKKKNIYLLILFFVWNIIIYIDIQFINCRILKNISLIVVYCLM